MPTIRSFFMILTLLLSPFPDGAQELQDHTRLIPVNVLDSHGNAVRDLTKGNFRARINGKPALVLSAEYSLAPRRIVVLLDTSGSMAGRNRDNTKWQIATEALTDLLAMTPGSVPLALLVFSDRVNLSFGFEQGRPAITDWVRQGASQRGKLRGRTALFDATADAVKLLQPPRPGDSIYAITDGGDNASAASARNIERTLALSGVRFYVFLFAEPSITEEEKYGVDSVTHLAINTGGFVFGARTESFIPGGDRSSLDARYEYNELTKEKLKLYAQELNIQVNGFYTLRVPEPSSPKDSKITLEVLDKLGNAKKDAAFTYCRELPPAK